MPPLTSLNRALDVLEAFTVMQPSWALGPLSDHLGMAKPTVRRILVNLIDRGWVVQDPHSREYRLGLRCWEVGAATVNGLDLSAAAGDHVQDIARTTGEQATLWVYDQGFAVCIDRAEGPFRGGIRSYTHLGTRELTVRLASGRCLLAAQPPAEIDRVLSLLPDDEQPDPDRRQALLSHLATVAERGFDVSLGDRWPGVAAVGAVIRDPAGVARGAVGLSAPVSRFEGEVVDHSTKLVLDAAAQIAARLDRPAPTMATRS